jgi:hypothetical protein
MLTALTVTITNPLCFIITDHSLGQKEIKGFRTKRIQNDVLLAYRYGEAADSGGPLTVVHPSPVDVDNGRSDSAHCVDGCYSGQSERQTKCLHYA